jgi:hypothetical protein
MTHRSPMTVAAIALVALGVVACSANSGAGSTGGGGMGGRGGHPQSSSQSTPNAPGQFRLYEWGITADSNTLPPGKQTITALNIGGHTHELVIVKATDAAALPTKPDGSVDENALKREKVGEIADVGAGSSKRATFDLAPGSYVGFCNLVDDIGMGNGGVPMGGGRQHVHFELGMHTAFTVSAS